MSSFLNTIVQHSFNTIKNISLRRSRCPTLPLRRLQILAPKPIYYIIKLNLTQSTATGHFVNIATKGQANTRHFCTRPFDVNTKITKDVIIYKYDNARFYKIINIFALCQFVFWNYLSHFAFTTLKDAPTEKPHEDDPWYRKINLGENKYRNSITVFCFLIGYGILTAAWMFTLRSVRYLVLMKGGKEITIITYAPFNKSRLMKVPINCMSAQESRLTAKTQLPIKVKDKYLYYILDMKGEFTNSKLFDYTAGLNRKF